MPQEPGWHTRENCQYALDCTSCTEFSLLSDYPLRSRATYSTKGRVYGNIKLRWSSRRLQVGVSGVIVVYFPVVLSAGEWTVLCSLALPECLIINDHSGFHSYSSVH